MGIQRFASTVARAQTVAALGACVLDVAPELMGAPVVALYTFREKGVDVHGRNLPHGLVDRYERHGRAHDPLLAAICAVHAPRAASVVEMRRHARAHRLPDTYMELLDDSLGLHCVMAPVVADGEVVGTINVARTEDRAFGEAELTVASALSLHVSARLAALRALASGVDEAWQEVLTRRGLEVADLAARGLTTREIGRVLGISSNTAKKHLRIIYERLGVATRAELARTLTGTPRTSAARRR